MYLAAPVCPNCSGELNAAVGADAPHWLCPACNLIVLDTPKTATSASPTRDA